MKIETTYTYEEGYFPTKRHRKLRYRDVEKVTTVYVDETTKEEAPIALVARLWSGDEEYRVWSGRLWKPLLWKEMVCNQEGLFPVDELILAIQRHNSKGDSEQAAKLRKQLYASQFLLMDGVVYKETLEPRYVVMTFGLSGNHGGTSLLIDTGYNNNISRTRYYNALDYERAVEDALQIAENRRDTKSVESIKASDWIDVLIPEAVSCNPAGNENEEYSTRVERMKSYETDYQALLKKALEEFNDQFY